MLNALFADMGPGASLIIILRRTSSCDSRSASGGDRGAVALTVCVDNAARLPEAPIDFSEVRAMKHFLFVAPLTVMLVAAGAFSAISADGAALYKACANCHGADGTQKADHVLKGQTSQQIVIKLKGYAAGTYGGDRKDVMRNKVRDLSDADMKSLGDHIATF